MSDTIPNYIDYSAENYTKENRKKWAEHPYGTAPIKYGYFSDRRVSDYETYLPHRRAGRYGAQNENLSQNERTPLLTKPLPTIQEINISNLAPREKTAKLAETLQAMAEMATDKADNAWDAIWTARHPATPRPAAAAATAAAARAQPDGDQQHELEQWKELEKIAIKARMAAKEAAYIAAEVARTAKWYRTAAEAEQVRQATEQKIVNERLQNTQLEELLNKATTDKEQALAQITGNIFTHDNPYARYGFANINWNEGDFIINLDNLLAEKGVAQAQLQGQNQAQPATHSLKFGLVGCHGVDGILWGEDGLFSGYALPPTSHRALKQIGTQLSNSQSHQFNFLLGDNFYHFGTTDPRSKQFSTCFHRVFKNVPAFAILGNHDYNMHGQEKGPLGVFRAPHPRMRKIYRAMCQVYHSYIANRDHDTLTNEFPHQWNMPFRYYALVSVETNTVFICIDSNTLPFDKVQQEWLYKTYRLLSSSRSNTPDGTHTSKPRNMILVSHHPLEYYGERASKPDEWKKYVQKDLQSQGFPQEPELYYYTEAAGGAVNAIKIQNPLSGGNELDKNKTIGHYLKCFLEQNHLVFSVIFAAHEHLLAYEKIRMYYRGRNIEQIYTHQFISGAGGADLEALTHETLTSDQRTFAADQRFFRVYHKEGNNPYQVKYGYMSTKLNHQKLEVTVHKIEAALAAAVETITIDFSQNGEVRFTQPAATLAPAALVTAAPMQPGRMVGIGLSGDLHTLTVQDPYQQGVNSSDEE